jgi:hypothetical protein
LQVAAAHDAARARHFTQLARERQQHTSEARALKAAAMDHAGRGDGDGAAAAAAERNPKLVAAVDELLTAVLTSSSAVEPPGKTHETHTKLEAGLVVERLAAVVLDAEAQLCALQCDAKHLQSQLTFRDERVRSLEQQLDREATDAARLRASGEGRVAAAERAAEAEAEAAAVRAAALEARVAVLVERVTAAHAQVREISPRPVFPAGDFGYRGMRGAVGKDTCSLCKRTLQPAPSTGVVAFYC